MPKAKRPITIIAGLSDSLTSKDLDILPDGLCFVRGCPNFWENLGMCKAHHNRFLKYGHPLAHGGPRHAHTDRVFRPKFRERKTWNSMWERCTKPTHKAWKHYGGRGISICDRWKDFEAFYEDMGAKPNGTSIERKDSNGSYEPGNCVWADINEQNRNKAKRVLTAEIVGIARGRFLRGERFSDLAKEYGVSITTMWAVVRGKSWRGVEPIYGT